MVNNPLAGTASWCRLGSRAVAMILLAACGGGSAADFRGRWRICSPLPNRRTRFDNEPAGLKRSPVGDDEVAHHGHIFVFEVAAVQSGRGASWPSPPGDRVGRFCLGGVNYPHRSSIC